jgi:hypothetical protein
MRSLTTLLALAACMITAILGPVESPAASGAATRTYSLASDAPVAGEPGLTPTVRTKIAFPTNWKVVHQTRGTLTLGEGQPNCRYTVHVRTRVAASVQSTAAARAAAALPATGPYVLRSRALADVARRVVRVQDRQRTRVEAIRDAPFDPPTASDGKHLWVETRISAASGLNQECHAGSYRETLAGGLARALDGAMIDAKL